jgi:FAD/FMN-containing dehydrogenase
MQAMAVLKPTSTEEVSRVLALCLKNNQPGVVQGGLAGVVQGADATKQDIVVSLERMNRIEEVDEEQNIAVVESGVILQTLQETLTAKDLLFPLDLGARGSCAIGGNVATNAGGINLLRYGMMRNLVLGLEVVLMNGTVLSSMYPMLKNNTGYDLKQLFMGSEATLGVVTKVLLRLFPLPVSRQSVLVAPETFSAVSKLLNQFNSGLAGTLSAFEVMWNNYYNGVTGDAQKKPPLGRSYPYYTMIEAEGFDPESDDLRFSNLLETVFENGLIIDTVVAKSERERDELWLIREEFDAILPAYLYDVSLPIKSMSDYTNELENRLRSELTDTSSVVFGHIADGNLHIFVQPYRDDNHHDLVEAIVYSTLDKFGGSVSAEHDIGLEKKAWLSVNRSSDELKLMQQIKQVFDPDNLLNPGKVFNL